MHRVFVARSIGPATAAAGLLCAPLELALVEVYNALLRESGVDAVCVPLPVADTADLAETLCALAPLGLRAFAVTPGALAAAGSLPAVAPDRRSAAAGVCDVLVVHEGCILGSYGGSPAEQVARLRAALVPGTAP